MSNENITVNLDGKTIYKLSNYVIAFFGFLALLFVLVLPVLVTKEVEVTESENVGIGAAFAGQTFLIGLFSFINAAGSLLMVVKGFQSKVPVYLPALLLVSTLFVGFAAPIGEKLGTGSVINIIIFGLCTIIAVIAAFLNKDNKK